uniref:molybdopterin adenylyltransferase n=1 Tax=Steinernema glaseri TaxID=37863 RepID=A0A1I7YAF6_9BILA
MTTFRRVILVTQQIVKEQQRKAAEQRRAWGKIQEITITIPIQYQPPTFGTREDLRANYSFDLDHSVVEAEVVKKAKKKMAALPPRTLPAAGGILFAPSSTHATIPSQNPAANHSPRAEALARATLSIDLRQLRHFCIPIAPFQMCSHPRISQWPRVSMAEALETIGREIGETVTAEVESLSVGIGNQLLERVLAEDVVAAQAMPAFRASIKDGYAVIAADGAGPRKVVSVTTAGATSTLVLQPGQCCRVSTGSMVVNGADAVVMREYTKPLPGQEDRGEHETDVMIEVAPKVGQDIRDAGADFQEGTLLVPKGTRLLPQHIGLIESSCRRIVKVYAELGVVFMSTGNELYSAESTSESVVKPPFGFIHDSNRPQIYNQLLKHGFAGVDYGIVPDNKEDLQNKLREAIESEHQFIVTTGGVSMGEKDHMKGVLAHLGCHIHFGRVAMKPGMPTTFATVTNSKGVKKFIFSLPGNPVSAYVCMEVFVVPFIKKKAGFAKTELTRITVSMENEVKLDERPEYRRAVLVVEDGKLIARTTHPNQTSSALINIRDCNILIELPARSEDSSAIKAGDSVNVLVVGPL